MSKQLLPAALRDLRNLTATIAAGTMLALASPPAAAQEIIRMTAAAGHPPIFLWVKLIRETFMATVDAELAKTGKYKMQWNEAYGSTLAKIGSELETMQQGVSDIGIVSSVFQSAKLPLNNVTYFVPFGPDDANVVTKAMSNVQDIPELVAEWSRYNLVYLAGFAIDNYYLATTFPINKVEDLKGRKLGGAGPNLNWLKETGAVGVQGSLNTLYNDIKSGIYDGAFVFATAAMPAKLFEVAPNLIKLDFGAMHAGALAVNKSRWDKLPEEVKLAFRKAANAYKGSYLAEQTARVDTSLAAWQKAGGKIIKVETAERTRLVKMIPNPTREWMKQAGPSSKKVLSEYMNQVRATGYKFARDFDKE